MEMAGRGTQTFTELTGHRTCNIITFMSLMRLIPALEICEKLKRTGSDIVPWYATNANTRINATFRCLETLETTRLATNAVSACGTNLLNLTLPHA
jgi:hypothetical protein